MENSTQDNGTELELRLNNPDTVAMLNRLLDRVEELESSVSAVSSAVGQGSGLVAMTGDIMDETYRKAAESGVDIEERLSVGMGLLNRLTEPATAKRLEGLLELSEQLPGMAAMVGDIVDDTYQNAAQSGMLDGIMDTAQALSASREMPPQQLGPMGLMRAMRDPDVQKAMGYLMNLAKALGQKM